ncbi:hypothetical protein PAXRUDRAFT_176250 [Paxillus rubicundulus Ve08.2h10]|uniref:Uncharacterized protein n=1 Tax=Paxillus rubicundulus Ve08.2h10 TaxID=930991 RepID=A0A0D0CFU5_9AGAM|nr:hypothetical protein PAXRUDRAFT_176250 [Paxillus rubicundulus Ve08.2h10]
MDASCFFRPVADIRTTRTHAAHAGVAELLVFHPVDIVAKRLMSNKAKVRILINRQTAHV